MNITLLRKFFFYNASQFYNESTYHSTKLMYPIKCFNTRKIHLINYASLSACLTASLPILRGEMYIKLQSGIFSHKCLKVHLHTALLL